METQNTTSSAAYTLLTPELERRFAEVGMQESNDPIIICKFFHPCSAATWWASEFDPETRHFFGYVYICEGEWGYFSLDELESARGHFGLPIERDLYFRECRFSELRH